MKKMMKRVSVILVLLSLLSLLLLPASATGETPVDYAALFAKAETVDGHSAEAYFYEMNQLFDSDPEAFVLALSKETFNTIETQAFNLAAEHDYSGMDAYEAVLNTIGQKYPDNQAVQDTLYLMRMNILYIKNQPNVINPNHFQENYHETVRQHFSDNPQLFLTSLSTKLSTYQANYHIRKLAQAMVYGSNEKELKALDDELQVCENADWAEENVQTVVQLLRTKIDTVLNPIDYTALFDKEATMDDGQIEGYYFEVNQIFEKDPTGFITALTQRSFPQIYSIASAIARERQNTSEEYYRLLFSIDHDYLSDAAEQDTLYVMRLTMRCLEIVLSPNEESGEALNYYFKNEHRLYLTTMAQMSHDQQAFYMNGMLGDCKYEELKELDAYLYMDSTCDWATEDVKSVIDLYRNAIKEVIYPAGDPDPDPPAQPDTDGPAPSEPTTGTPAPTNPTAVDTTVPTAVIGESTEIAPATSWVIPIVIISAVLTIAIVLVLVLKKQ